jgi:hypothetical protein
MFYQLQKGNGNVEIRLEPELARLSRAYRNTVRDLKVALEKEQGVLRIRLNKKLDQLTLRIRTVLGRAGLTAEQTNDWIVQMENQLLEAGGVE